MTECKTRHMNHGYLGASGLIGITLLSLHFNHVDPFKMLAQ